MKVRSTGFLQGWSYTVAHAQSCRWLEIGSIVPLREFLCGVIECSLRLFGPASVERQLSLSTDAATRVEHVHDHFERQKMCMSHRSAVRDYFSKHSQWIGSLAALDHIERESLRYLAFMYSGAEGGVRHRMTDPRGDPRDPPAVCICQEPVVLKQLKRKGPKQSQKNVGRHYWTCVNHSTLAVLKVKGSF